MGIARRRREGFRGSTHLLASAAVVLLAPMTMAAASIEGSPLRDAIRGPFERLGIVPPESVRDGAAPDVSPAPVAPDVATGSQADQADPESATARRVPVLGEDPLDDLLGLAPDLGAEMP